jgi:nitronate monooxygenase
MDDIQRLAGDYPWVQTPLVVSAPMRLIALADMAVEVSKAGKSWEKRAKSISPFNPRN